MKKEYSIFHTLSCLYKGQSLLRIRMNTSLSNVNLRGRVVDIGGGRSPDYFNYFQTASDTQIDAIDVSMTGIDFEKDELPYDSQSIDSLVCCNVLEHIYAHQHLLMEMKRILKPRGLLVGFVPFWTGYHPDPHDYFRYTDEALTRMLTDAGFSDITIQPLSVGPILANFNTIVLSVPRAARPILYIWYAFWNLLFVTLRPSSVTRHPLGYIFTASRV